MKNIKLLIVACLCFLSCSEDKDNEFLAPTFKVDYFEREKINDEYHCKAVISITGLVDRYSIDGILYSNNIQGINLNLPFNENYKYNVSNIDNNKFYFNISGSHRGDLKLSISWTSKENRDNYMVGFHLTYGFGLNCEPLIINLQTK